MNLPISGDSVTSVLSNAQTRIPALEARLLLSAASDLTRTQIIAHSNQILDQQTITRFTALVLRRAAGEPIAYILGEREFYGRSLIVTPAVLIPRPETELLVELALARLHPSNLAVLDMGTGSGALAVTLACEHPAIKVTATDISADALAVARRNAERHGAALECVQSDWYKALGGRQFGLIVSNPPYIAAADAHLSQGDLRFEPRGALTEEADGLAALRIIIAQGPAHLSTRGWLLVEHGYDQAAAVRALFAAAGFQQVQSWCDLAGIERASGGMWVNRPE